MAGKTLREAGIGAVVVGQWSRSRLRARCSADMRIEPGSILELVGDAESLERAARILGGNYLRRDGPFLIAGFGEVGRKVHELLTDAGEQVRVIERQPLPGVDCVGNVLDLAVLEKAGLSSARAVILALNSDDASLFATVIVRDAVADVAVIARVNHGRNFDNIDRAGADFVLSISDVSGEMLSARLLGRAVRSPEEHRQVLCLPVKQMAGKTLRELAIRRDGCSALAIRRGNQIIARLNGDIVLQLGDALYVCGVADTVRSMEL